jgi:hypothetical protein
MSKILEHAEELLYVHGLVLSREVLNYVETHGLRQGAALTHGHNIGLAYVGECGGAVHGEVAVLLAKTPVFVVS